MHITIGYVLLRILAEKQTIYMYISAVSKIKVFSSFPSLRSKRKKHASYKKRRFKVEL